MAYHPDNPRYCAGCHKVHKACVCHWLKNVESLPIHFWVHPNERSRARSTSWLAHRMLSHSTYTVDESCETNFSHAALLFPGDEWVPWNQVTFSRVVVLDGTWDECRAILRKNPSLQTLPKIGLQGVYSGAFQVRRPPWEGALCTAEAVGRLLLEMQNCDGQYLLDLVSQLNLREAQWVAKENKEL